MQDNRLKFVYVLSLGLFDTPESHVPLYQRMFFWYCKYSEINNRFYSRDDVHYCTPSSSDPHEDVNESSLMSNINIHADVNINVN